MAIELNENQREAAYYDGDKYLVIEAGPGAGKTRVLIERIKFLINQKKVDPSTLLVITFTHKAAEGLQAAVAKMPARQKDSGSGFDEAKFDKLLAKAKSYGDRVKIVCTEMFAQKIPTDTYLQTGLQEIRDFGYVRKYKGADVQVLPNALKDNVSEEWQIDNKTAYILPVGKNAKIVKITLEGQSEMDEYKDDQTKETVYEVYDKAGVAVVTLPYVFAYTDTSL